MARKAATGDWMNDKQTEEVLAKLDLTDCDAVMVTDGSGTTWNNACGWASVIIDRKSNHRKVLQGAMNFGTSYLAELIPYVHAMSWYIEGPGRSLLNDKLSVLPSDRVRVHAITDNETIAKQGQGKMGRKTGNYYWAMFDAMEEQGYEIYWHWLPRSKLCLNRLCDHLAGLCRKSIQAVEGVTMPAEIQVRCNTLT